MVERDAIWVVLPVKPFALGKSRLMLSASERDTVNRAFYGHVLSIACATVPPAHVVVVSRDEAVLALARRGGARVVRESGAGDLNEALTSGAAFAKARGARGVLSLFADLPFLERDDLLAMIDAFAGDNFVIAPDEAGAGSNALLMMPGALPYRHGSGSFWRHLDAAREAGGVFGIVRRDGLMRDVDVPDQLATVRKLHAAH